MHTPAIRTILSCAAIAAAASAQAIITPGAADPNFGPATITTDFNNNLIQTIDQIEMRSLGGGTYRTIVTAEMVGQADSKLVSGLLNLSTNPPSWTATNDLELLNVAGTATDEFQGSMSANGLVVVWDNYAGTNYPNMPAPAQTFVCRRASTGVQFAVNDVRGIAGMPAGGVDPHIAQDLPSGNVLIMFLDANGNISKCEVDPATGNTTNTTQAVINTGRVGWQFCHSPWANRDSTGRAIAMGFSEYISSGGARSDYFWTEGINNDGTPNMVADGTLGGVNTWYANPTIQGGTFVIARATAGYLDPLKVEAAMIANENLRGGSGRLVVMAPARPQNPGPSFLSAIGIGNSSPPYQIPPVQGDILIFPSIGVTDARPHDPYTGNAEWPLTGLMPFGNAQFEMQNITIDLTTLSIYAGNVATVLY
jgi:hypothetical protein